jgi:hypothetical protein
MLRYNPKKKSKLKKHNKELLNIDNPENIDVQELKNNVQMKKKIVI